VIPLIVLSLSCASGVLAMYQDERAAALATPNPAGNAWQPQVRVRISQDALDDIVQTALDQGLLSWTDAIELKGPLGLTAQVKPSATIKQLSLSASRQCTQCLDVNARLKGKAAWTAAGASGKVPFTARLGATVAFDISQDGETWVVAGRLRDVDRVQVGSAILGSLDATSLLGDWVEQALKRTKAMDIGSLGGTDLPLRAARLSTTKSGLEFQLLTDLSEGSAVSAGGTMSTDFDLRVSSDTALALARRAAFKTGAIAVDVAAIPTALDVTGDQFTMGLRLWKLDGAGWWRDYQVMGALKVKGKRIVLNPTEATQGEKSRGAGLADPMALLAEGRILSAVENGLHQALPGSTGAKLGRQRLTAQVAQVSGDDGVITLAGAITQGRPAAAGSRVLGR